MASKHGKVTRITCPVQIARIVAETEARRNRTQSTDDEAPKVIKVLRPSVAKTLAHSAAVVARAAEATRTKASAILAQREVGNLAILVSPAYRVAGIAFRYPDHLLGSEEAPGANFETRLRGHNLAPSVATLPGEYRPLYVPAGAWYAFGK